VDEFAEASAVATRALAALNLPSAPRRRLLAAALQHRSNSPELQLHASLSTAATSDITPAVAATSATDARNTSNPISPRDTTKLGNLRVDKFGRLDSSVSASPEAAIDEAAPGPGHESSGPHPLDQNEGAPTTPQQKVEFKDRYILGPSTC